MGKKHMFSSFWLELKRVYVKKLIEKRSEEAGRRTMG